MAFFQYATVTVLVLLKICCANTVNIRNVDTDRHIWAPISSLKSPYVTFINDFNWPSWSTRHSMTKRKGPLRHLKLPKTVPFAVICGACFRHSMFTPNLTISISDHLSQSVPKRRRDRSFQYTVGINECLMTYMITEPIQKDGTITCTLNRGKQRITEVISFDAVDVEVQEPPEEIEIGASASAIELECPQRGELIKKDNPTMNVWHEEMKEESTKKSVGSPIISTRPTVYLNQPKYTTTIVCSVYNIISPSIVHQTRYKIIGSLTNAKPEYHVSDILNYEDAEVLHPNNMSLSTTVLAIIITAVVVCVLLAVMGMYRFIAAARLN